MTDNLNSKKGSGAKFGVFAVLVGVISYVAGLLTASKSGEETRSDIKETVVKKRSDAEKELKNLQSELNNLLKKAEAKADDLKVKSDTKKQELVDVSYKAKDKAEQVIDAVKTKEITDPDLQKAVTEIRKAKDNLAKFIKS